MSDHAHLFEEHVQADPAALSTLRRDFAAWLEHEGAPAGEIDDWRLIASELAANACAASPDGATIDVRATCAAGRVVLRVRNPAGVALVPRVPGDVDSSADGRRGLFVVDRLTDGVVFEVDDGYVCATCWKDTAASTA